MAIKKPLYVQVFCICNSLTSILPLSKVLSKFKAKIMQILRGFQGMM